MGSPMPRMDTDYRPSERQVWPGKVAGSSVPARLLQCPSWTWGRSYLAETEANLASSSLARPLRRRAANDAGEEDDDPWACRSWRQHSPYRRSADLVRPCRLRRPDVLYRPARDAGTTTGANLLASSGASMTTGTSTTYASEDVSSLVPAGMRWRLTAPIDGAWDVTFRVSTTRPRRWRWWSAATEHLRQLARSITLWLRRSRPFTRE